MRAVVIAPGPHLLLKYLWGPSNLPKVAQSITVCNSFRLFWMGVLRISHTKESPEIRGSSRGAR